jgi:hypothetical protein
LVGIQVMAAQRTNAQIDQALPAFANMMAQTNADRIV